MKFRPEIVIPAVAASLVAAIGGLTFLKNEPEGYEIQQDHWTRSENNSCILAEGGRLVLKNDPTLGRISVYMPDDDPGGTECTEGKEFSAQLVADVQYADKHNIAHLEDVPFPLPQK